MILIFVQLSVTEDGDAMSAMMGGGAGGALMYLIFDPEMEELPRSTRRN